LFATNFHTQCLRFDAPRRVENQAAAPMTSDASAIRNGDVHTRPVVGNFEGNNVMKSSSFGTVVVGKTVNRSVPVVVVVTAAAVVVGAIVVVLAATVVVGAMVVVLPATVVVVPTTVVVVVGAIVVVVVGAIVVVVVGAIVVVVVGAIVVVVVGSIVVVVVDGAMVVDVVLVVLGAVVVVTGDTMAPLLIDRSWLPTEQFLSEHMKSMSLMWYGDPLIDDAELPAPQSVWAAMWPDHERTTVADDAVK